MKKSNLFILLSSITSVSAAFGSGVLYAYILANSVNYVELGILTSVMLILTIILEYPSGIIADYIGRKKNVCIRSFFRFTFLYFAGVKYFVYYSSYCDDIRCGL